MFPEIKFNLSSARILRLPRGELHLKLIPPRIVGRPELHGDLAPRAGRHVTDRGAAESAELGGGRVGPVVDEEPGFVGVETAVTGVAKEVLREKAFSCQLIGVLRTVQIPYLPHR